MVHSLAKCRDGQGHRGDVVREDIRNLRLVDGGGVCKEGSQSSIVGSEDLQIPKVSECSSTRMERNAVPHGEVAHLELAGEVGEALEDGRERGEVGALKGSKQTRGEVG